MKKHKRIWAVAIVLALAIGISLLFSKKEPVIIEPRISSVKVLSIKLSENQQQLKYIGIVQPLETQQATFGTIGSIEAVYVKEGDRVKNGHRLATLDSENARINYQNAQEELRIANLNRKQANETMNAEEANYLDKKRNQESLLESSRLRVEEQKYKVDEALAKRDEALLEFGEESEAYAEAQATYLQEAALYELYKAEYEQSLQADEPVEVSIAYARYQASKAAFDASVVQYTIAKNNVDLAKSNLEATELRSSMDGIVIMVLSQAGDLATPLAPVVVIASYQSVASIGLSQQATALVSVNNQAKITINQVDYTGYILDIAKIPDTSSRTYLTRILIEQATDLNIGETAAVTIDTGFKEGVWLPLNTIRNDGEDFVYLVKDGRVVRRVITISSIYNDLVSINGLSVDDQIIVEGGKNLRPGMQVEVAEVVSLYD